MRPDSGVWFGLAFGIGVLFFPGLALLTRAEGYDEMPLSVSHTDLGGGRTRGEKVGSRLLVRTDYGRRVSLAFLISSHGANLSCSHLFSGLAAARMRPSYRPKDWRTCFVDAQRIIQDFVGIRDL